MRNLKKFLALVLAMMMVMGLMVTVNAASFTDAADIDEKYATAADVLAQLGVLKGTDNYDGTFTYHPEDNLTRAQFAAILYRIHSGDAEENRVGNYKSSAFTQFSDIPENAWYAGQLGYCVDNKLLFGDGANYWPDGQVTNTQVVIGMLRALGYDKKDELKGPDAGTQAVITGNGAGILNVVSPYSINDNPASRQTIAQLAFDTLLNGRIVNYREGTGGYYDGNGEILNGETSAGPTLGEIKYDLRQLTDSEGDPVDAILVNGNPSAADARIIEAAQTPDVFGRPAGLEVWTARNNTIVFTVGSATLVKTFYSAMSEEELFAAIGAEGIKGKFANYIVMDSITVDGTEVATSSPYDADDQELELNPATGKWEYSGTEKAISYWDAASPGGTPYDKHVVIAKNDNSNITGFGNGTTVEIYATGTANHYKMVAINEYLGYVTAVDENAGTITIQNLPQGGSDVGTDAANSTIEAEGFEVGDAVLYTVATDSNTSTTTVQSVAVPGTVSGTVTKIVRSDRKSAANYHTYTIGGKTYKISLNSTALALSVDLDSEWYLDSHGNIIGDVTPAVPDTVYHYGYLLGYEANDEDERSNDEFLLETGGTNTYKVVGEKFWFIDENGKEVTLDGEYTLDTATGKASKFVASELLTGVQTAGQGVASKSKGADASYDEWISGKDGTSGILFKYTLNAKGEISLVKAVSEDDTSLTEDDGDKVKVTKGTAAISSYDSSEGTTAVEDIYGTDETIYFIIQYGTGATANKVVDFTVVKGYGKVPTTESAAYNSGAKWGWILVDTDDPNTTNVDERENMEAMFLVVESMSSAGTNSYVYFAGVSGTEIIKERIDKDTLTYTYTNVYVDGVKGQITVKVTAANVDALDSIDDGELYIVTIGEDGYSVIDTVRGDLLALDYEVTAVWSGYFTVDNGTDGKIDYYYDGSTAFYQVDAGRKSVSKVNGLPAVADGYTITLLLVDDGTAADDPASVVYFTRTKDA